MNIGDKKDQNKTSPEKKKSDFILSLYIVLVTDPVRDPSDLLLTVNIYHSEIP